MLGVAELKMVFACCLCGEKRGDDLVTLRANWPEDDKEQWQAWGAHRACLIAAMCDEARNAGGPLTADE
jgi:hypothetical protein